VKNGGWRVLRLVARTLLAAIAPCPSLQAIQASTAAIRRHATEPPRKRHYQNVSMVS
jgi:hypothetical protein